MNLSDTYIVCNSAIIPKFKTINHFKLDLGKALINTSQQFHPSDVIIQKHFLIHSEIINMCGHIGSLTIYTNRSCENDEIIIYNMDNLLKYKLDINMDLYNNINNGIELFFEKYEIKKDVDTQDTSPEVEINNTYVKPSKNMSEMTMEERIAFARNNK